MPKPDNATLKALNTADWDDIIPRLLLFALGKIRKMVWRGVYNGEPPAAMEAHDIVHNAIQKVFSGERPWARNISLFSFLAGVVKSEISNLVRGFDNKKISRIDHKKTHIDQKFLETYNLILIEINFESERTEILKYFENDDLAQEIIKLIIDEDITKPLVMSRILDVPITDIYNARKRIRRILEKENSIRCDKSTLNIVNSDLDVLTHGKGSDSISRVTRYRNRGVYYRNRVAGGKGNA